MFGIVVVGEKRAAVFFQYGEKAFFVFSVLVFIFNGEVGDDSKRVRLT